MKKEDVIQQIVKNLKESVSELEEQPIDADANYSELGVGSLDLVDTVNKTMREMGVRISPSDLGKVNTLNELAELFVAAKKA